MSQTNIQYRSTVNLNIYDAPNLERLATQMAKGRYLRMLSEEAVVKVKLVEDDYEGFVRLSDLAGLQFAGLVCYYPLSLSAFQIQERISAAIAYTQQAMAQPNEYLWGGTLPPNYDCSGLIQAAFASVNVWLPRDAYQQENFATPVLLPELALGDLIFFGKEEKANHVGMYLGNNHYIHSSGKEQGRNGIGIDVLEGGDEISQRYATQIRGAGRVTRSYQPVHNLTN